MTTGSIFRSDWKHANQKNHETQLTATCVCVSNTNISYFSQQQHTLDYFHTLQMNIFHSFISQISEFILTIKLIVWNNCYHWNWRYRCHHWDEKLNCKHSQHKDQSRHWELISCSVTSEGVARRSKTVTNPLTRQFEHFGKLMRELKSEQVSRRNKETSTFRDTSFSSGSEHISDTQSRHKLDGDQFCWWRLQVNLQVTLHSRAGNVSVLIENLPFDFDHWKRNPLIWTGCPVESVRLWIVLLVSVSRIFFWRQQLEKEVYRGAAPSSCCWNVTFADFHKFSLSNSTL